MWMLFLLLALLFAPSAQAQVLISPALAQTGQFPTQNGSVKITTGLTYQVLTPAGQNMRSLTIQNNNASDSCWIEISGLVTTSMTTTTPTNLGVTGNMTPAQVSILLAPGGSYGRYYPNIPKGPIVGTCPANTDSLYVDWQ